MESLRPFLFILATLLGALAQEDLWNKSFVFPAASDTAAVYLHVSNQQPLTKLTVCLRYYTLLARPYGLFSYATGSSDNDFLIFKNQTNEYLIYIGGSGVTFQVAQEETPSWKHICVSWDTTNGLVQLWLNGEPLPRQGLKKGYTIRSGASIVLGQDQDSVGGGFDVNQSYIGEISEVNMWARVLSPAEVGLSKNNMEFPGTLINWRSLSYNIKNEVFVEDLLAPQNTCV